jgi:hypothetical protein
MLCLRIKIQNKALAYSIKNMQLKHWGYVVLPQLAADWDVPGCPRDLTKARLIAIEVLKMDQKNLVPKTTTLKAIVCTRCRLFITNMA